MHQSTTGERITAAISTIVAIAILGAAVAAQQSRAPKADRLASLESDLRFQLDLSFRSDGSALNAHLAAVDDAVAAWRGSRRTDVDDGLLAEWLRDSVRHALPGSDGKLPPAPEFANEAPRIVTPARAKASPAPADPSPELADATPASVRRATTPVVPAPTAPARVNTAQSSAAPPRVTSAAPDAPTIVPGEHSIAVPAPRSTPQTGHAALQAPPTLIASNAAALPAVQVNLAELTARIRGYEEGLADVEAAVVAVGAPTPEVLEMLVSRLENLAAQYQFVELYYDSLTKAERRRVTAPRPMSEAIALVARYAAAPAEGGDFLADFEATPGGAPTLAERLKSLADAVSAVAVEVR